MAVSKAVVAAMAERFQLPALPYEKLLQLWHACRLEYVRREILAVHEFQVGDSVQFRSRNGTLDGVVLERHHRSLKVGVLTSPGRAFKFVVSPFNARHIEPSVVTSLAAMTFNVQRELSRPNGDPSTV